MIAGGSAWTQHAQAVQRLRASYSAIPAGQPVRLAKKTSNLFRFGERFPPGALQLQHLRPAHEAFAPEEHVGMCIAPRGQRGGPLFCAAQIEAIVTRAEHAAVDDARDDRVDLAAGDAHHHFVEHREALRDLVLAEQHASLSMTCEGEHIAILET